MATTHTTNQRKPRTSRTARNVRPVLIYSKPNSELPLIQQGGYGILTAVQSHLKLVYSSDAKPGAYVPGIASNESYSQVRRLLRAVLDAKLTPTLTVEEACHLRIYGEDEHIPRMDSLLDDLKELRSAGLDANVALGNLPDGIVLTDPTRFKARFPQLSEVVPVMLAHGGVQPYTAGLPRHPASRSDV